MSAFVREEWCAWPFLISLSSLCRGSGLDVFSWWGKAYRLPTSSCVSQCGRSLNFFILFEPRCPQWDICRVLTYGFVTFGITGFVYMETSRDPWHAPHATI